MYKSNIVISISIIGKPGSLLAKILSIAQKDNDVASKANFSGRNKIIIKKHGEITAGIKSSKYL